MTKPYVILVAAMTLLAGCASATEDPQEPQQAEENVGVAQQRLARDCTSLGKNSYCDGSTLVVNNDFICTGGGEQWVESDSKLVAGGCR